LTLSPLLMEKYINAATEVIEARVPVVSAVPQQRWFTGKQYEILQKSKPRPVGASSQTPADTEESEEDEDEESPTETVHIDKENLKFSYRCGGTVKLNFTIDQAGKYDFLVMLATGEDYVDGVFDANRCQVKIDCDGKTIADEEFARLGWVKRRYHVIKNWEKGDHWMTVDVTPLTDEKNLRRLRLEIGEARLTGPLNDPGSFVFPERHGDFFPEAIPEDDKARKQYAHKLLSGFAKRAFVYGSGNADGNRHTHTNLPILLAGKGGGSVVSGRQGDHKGKPLTNLFLSMADRMGVDGLDSFGDSTGRLKDV